MAVTYFFDRSNLLTLRCHGVGLYIKKMVAAVDMLACDVAINRHMLQSMVVYHIKV